MRTRFLNFLILPLVAIMTACTVSPTSESDKPEDNPDDEEVTPIVPSVVDVTGVTLNANTLTLYEGDTYQLTVNILPSNATNKSFVTLSKNSTIASISSSGLITAKKAGNAVIVITTMEGGFKAECDVTVRARQIEPEVIKVSKVELTPASLSLKEREKANLSYTIYPENANDKTVSWTISDPNVASVESGLVVAKKEGSADINVITRDGNYSATCKLTVSKQEQPEEEGLPEINYVKVFADKSDYKNVYAWITDSNKVTKGWPGDAMSESTYSWADTNWLTYDFDPQYTSFSIIFNGSNGQTEDLYIPRVGYYWCYKGTLYTKAPTGKEEQTDLPVGNFEVVESAKDYTELPAVKNYNKGLVVNPYTGQRTDFRQESIYFMMTTRFYDGDSSNNRFCWDNQNKQDPEWRGDFKGLIEKMDYIKALGFTAIWITPVVKNASGYDYHGYHAINFGEVDPRYESEDVKFADVIKEAHKRDMKIVLDVVFNHTSNNGEENLFPMFKYDSMNATQAGLKPDLYYSLLPQNYDSLDGGRKFQARIQAMKTSKDGYNIYHHEMNMGYEQYIEQTGSLAGDCIDLNTENPTVANYLVDKFGDFIRMGVDAFRVDTVKHISRLTLNKYLLPGLYAIAEKCGNNNFFMFGEVCNRDRGVWNHNVAADSACFYTWKESKEYPWGDRKINEKSTLDNWNDNVSPDGQPTSDNVYLRTNYTYHEPDHSRNSGLGVIDFGMHWNFRYANDAYNVAKNNDQVYNDASYNVVYVDSHDYGPDGIESVRYNEGTTAWNENMSLMFTFRGVPCIYYGSEVEFMKGMKIDQYQNLSNSGRAYFGEYLSGSVTATGFGQYTASGTVKDTLNSTLSQHLMMLNKIRQKVPALSMGQYSAKDNMAFVRRYTKGNIDSLAVVAISSGSTFTGLPQGTYVDLVTGDRKTITNGTLNVSVSGKGNLAVYVLENSYTGKLSKIS